MTWVAVGVTAISTVTSIVGSNKAKKEAQAQAAAEERRARKEADLQQKDLFAEYDATVEEQRQALAQAELAKAGEAEAQRQAGLLKEGVSLDLSANADTVQQRAARRRNYFEG